MKTHKVIPFVVLIALSIMSLSACSLFANNKETINDPPSLEGRSTIEMNSVGAQDQASTSESLGPSEEPAAIVAVEKVESGVAVPQW